MRLFAGARERINLDSIQVELQVPASVRQLKLAIANQYELLQPFVEFGRIAIHNDFAEDTDMITQENLSFVIALIPPVSGG